MNLVSGLSLACVPPTSLRERTAAWWNGVLGLAVIGDAELSFVPPDVPVSRVSTPPLDGVPAVCEVWRTSGVVSVGVRGRIRYRHDGELLFGSVVMVEAEWEVGDGAEITGLQRATEAAYREIFALLDEAEYPNLFRVWNYFDGINEEAGGSERYWQFNAGRQAAFVASGRSAIANVPAACALGASGGPLTVYFMARRDLPVPVENPRQVSAYHYPACYGPRSPTFARASVAKAVSSPVLFVSGTASIVGHRTLHAGDVVAQTEESIRNIDAVLAHLPKVAPGEVRFGLEDLYCKVYVRREDDVEAVRTVVRKHVGPAAQVLYVQADVCRSDLLVEIEASSGHAMETER